MIAPRLCAVGVAAVTVALAQGVVGSNAVDPQSPGRTSVENDDEIIERTRRIALAYAGSLPDFICTQENRRFKDEAWDGPQWNQYAATVAEVRFVDKQESYRTIAVDGRPAEDDFKLVSGESGTFGSRLLGIFRPRSKASFTRTTDDVIEDREVYVFQVLLPTEHRGGGLISLGWNRLGLATWQIPVGSRGLVSIEKQTGNVLRIDSHEALGIPLDFPVRKASYRIEYGYVPIGDGTYVLPVRARYSMEMFPPALYRHDVEWRDCRKFDAESVLTFGNPIEESR